MLLSKETERRHLPAKQADTGSTRTVRVVEGKLSEREIALVDDLLERELGANALHVSWVQQVKGRSKVQARILAITEHRVITIKKASFTRKDHSSVNVSKQPHLLDLRDIKPVPGDCTLHWKPAPTLNIYLVCHVPLVSPLPCGPTSPATAASR
jgi:hypothetical protein